MKLVVAALVVAMVVAVLVGGGRGVAEGAVAVPADHTDVDEAAGVRPEYASLVKGDGQVLTTTLPIVKGGTKLSADMLKGSKIKCACGGYSCNGFIYRVCSCKTSITVLRNPYRSKSVCSCSCRR